MTFDICSFVLGFIVALVVVIIIEYVQVKRKEKKDF
jgi:hypothetical protein